MVVPYSYKSSPRLKLFSDPFEEINSAPFLKEIRAEKASCEKAFGRLFKHTQGPLTAFIRRYFSDSSKVEDILQDTYLATHNGLKNFEGRCKLSTWLFSLAYHKICDKLAEKYQGKELAHDSSHILESMECPEPLPDRVLMQLELIRLIDAVSDNLVPKYREVLYYRDNLGLSGEETALTLGIAEPLVRLRLHRARALIVENMRSKFPFVIQEMKYT